MQKSKITNLISLGLFGIDITIIGEEFPTGFLAIEMPMESI